MAETETGFVETIQELCARQPSDPFRIVIASGDKYLIEDPGNVVFGKTRIFYCYSRSDRVVYIRHNQITAIEQFEDSQGRRRRKSA